MQVPPTRYAECGERAIAYHDFGAGDATIVVLPGAAWHVELAWMDPAYASFMEELASFARVVVFDKGGTGLSDPVKGVPTLDERVDEVIAVARHANLGRVCLFGISEGAPTAVLFAAAHPDRCERLVLHGSVIDGSSLRPGWLDEFAELWGTGETPRIFGIETPAERNRKSARFGAGVFERAAASPSMFRAVIDAVRQIDVTAVLPAVTVPTLVMHRVDEPIPLEQARVAAAGIPGAELVELDGGEHHPWYGDVESVLRAIERFVTGTVHQRARTNRVLATLVFADVVGSTTIVADLGDVAWAALLDQFESAVREEIEQFGGREIFTKGDEFFIAFDGPARAAACAVAMRSRARRLGLEIRTGVHVGECEARDDDLSGLAVHTAARVMALADPGEILVTSTVRDLSVGSGLTFAERDTVELRGVPGTWDLSIVTEGRPEGIAVEPRSKTDRIVVGIIRRMPNVVRRMF